MRASRMGPKSMIGISETAAIVHEMPMRLSDAPSVRSVTLRKLKSPLKARPSMNTLAVKTTHAGCRTMRLSPRMLKPPR